MGEHSTSLGAGPTAGSHLGPYTLERVVGSGGSATVFEASGPEGARVAVKVLHPAKVLPEDHRRFEREYRTLSRISHENVVAVYATGIDDGYPWIAMEYVEGQDLDGLIAQWAAHPSPRRFPIVERLVRGLCAGLDHVHGLGLVHRDLKPSNVLVRADGVPKISDFGVVKDPNAASTQLTVAGRLVGTVAFMAPEQISGDHLDHRADLYALGAVLYMMLTFRRPIEASTVAGFLARHLTEVPKPPSELTDGVPPVLDALCMDLLKKEPSERPGSAREVMARLDRHAEGLDQPLRGRSDWLAEWSGRLATLREGAGGVVAIVGERGAGKTRLLDAMARSARAGGFDTRALGGVHPLGDLLRDLGASADGLSDAQLFQRLYRRLGREEQARVIVIDDLDLAARFEIDVLGRLIRALVGLEGLPILFTFSATAEGQVRDLLNGTTTAILPLAHTLQGLDRRALSMLLKDQGLGGPVAAALGTRFCDEHRGLPGAALAQLEALVEAGWLTREDDGSLVARRALPEFRVERLPIPARTRVDAEAVVARLPTEARRLAAVLALLDRPASPGLLARATELDDPEPAIGSLAARGVLRRVDEHGSITIGYPYGPVLSEQLDRRDRQSLHAAIAEALRGRRRRDATLELAHHLALAGKEAEAYPLLVKAARRAAHGRLSSEVLALCDRADRLADRAEAELPADEARRARFWRALLRGEATLQRGEWSNAEPALTTAVEVASAEPALGDLPRALGALGRAQYRLGQLVAATATLEQAVASAAPGMPDRAATVRALADIELRSGRLDRAQALWTEALSHAEAIASADDEARARRGFAHLHALRGDLVAARAELGRAEELLGPSGDERVRAAVAFRAVELDLAAGRLSDALGRAEIVTEQVQAWELVDRYPEAFALRARTELAVGRTGDAVASARQALVYAPHVSDAVGARIDAVRVLHVAGHSPDDASLPTAETAARDRAVDLPARLAALRARLRARSTPSIARDLAMWATEREPALLPLARTQTLIDASAALLAAGDSAAAIRAAKRAMKACEMPGTDGLRLEVLLVWAAAQPDDPRVLEAAGRFAERIARALRPALLSGFQARAGIGDALAAVQQD